MAPRFDIAYSNNPLVVRLFEEADIPVKQTELFDRADLKGSEIREQMINSGDWEQHVPEAVVEVIDEIDGIERIQAVSQVGSIDPD
jgi:nicotinamide-nucleotide adenylyltransferase